MATVNIDPEHAELWLEWLGKYRKVIESRKANWERTALLASLDRFEVELHSVIAKDSIETAGGDQ